MQASMERKAQAGHKIPGTRNGFVSYQSMVSNHCCSAQYICIICIFVRNTISTP